MNVMHSLLSHPLATAQSDAIVRAGARRFLVRRSRRG
jgi:hypothetical protein